MNTNRCLCQCNCLFVTAISCSYCTTLQLCYIKAHVPGCYQCYSLSFFVEQEVMVSAPV